MLICARVWSLSDPAMSFMGQMLFEPNSTGASVCPPQLVVCAERNKFERSAKACQCASSPRQQRRHSLGRASQLLYGRLDGLHRLIRKALMYRAFTKLSDIFPVGLLHGKSH
jgi:hypothetical protein